MLDLPNPTALKEIEGNLIALLWRSETYMQLALVLFAVLCAWLLALLCKSVIRRNISADIDKTTIKYQSLRVLKGVLLPFFSVMGITLMHSLSKELKWPFDVILNANSIAIAWLMISLVLHITRRHLVAQILAWFILIAMLLDVTNTLDPMQKLLDSFAFGVGTFRLSLLGVIKGGLVFIVLLWLTGALSMFIERKLTSSTYVDTNSRILSTKLIRMVLYFAVFIITLNSMGVDLTALAVFGGALGVGIGFGLQKIMSNFISGIILLVERTVKLGDLIQVGGETGWVRRMGIRYTLVENLDGREIMIPNEELITMKLVNWTYSSNKARVDIVLTVEYESDADKVKYLMIMAAKEYKGALRDPAPVCLLTEFIPLGMQFTLMFWIADINDGIRAAKSDVMFDVLRRFEKENIRFSRPA